MSDHNVSSSSAPQGDDPTADYRKYPKSPNFLLVVLGACIALIVIMIVAVMFLRGNASHMVPQHPNPHPNSSYLRPVRPTDGGTQLL